MLNHHHVKTHVSSRPTALEGENLPHIMSDKFPTSWMVPNISENKIPKVDVSVIVCHVLMPSLCTLLNLMLFTSTSKNSFLKISSTSLKHRATLRVLAEVPQTLTERLQLLKTWTTPIYWVSLGFSARRWSNWISGSIHIISPHKIQQIGGVLNLLFTQGLGTAYPSLSWWISQPWFGANSHQLGQEKAGNLPSSIIWERFKRDCAFKQDLGMPAPADYGSSGTSISKIPKRKCSWKDLRWISSDLW